MFSYEFYKVLHLTCIFLWIASLSCACQSSKPEKKHFILLGITSFFALVGGMGLLARIGVKHLGPWPHWAHAKLGIWFLISLLTHIGLKRFRSKSSLILTLSIILMGLAAYFAIYKP